MAREPDWLRSRSSRLVLLGFAANLAGLLGGALWLAPAEKAVDEASRAIALESTRAQLIRAATATAEVSDHLGALVFSVPVGDDPTDAYRRTLAELFTRALDRGHESVRAYVAELAVAGAVDFDSTIRRYERLVAAEQANFNLDTYRAANAFEADLAMAMVDAEGAASMKALKLQGTLREAKAVAARRRLLLTLSAAAGATVIFAAAFSGSDALPTNNATRALEAALRLLRTLGAPK